MTTNAAFDQLISELGVARDAVKFVGDHTLRVLKSHFDSVQQLPTTATVLATSPSAPNEIYSIAAKTTTVAETTSSEAKAAVPQRFIGIQGHPGMRTNNCATKIFYLSSSLITRCPPLSISIYVYRVHTFDHRDTDNATCDRNQFGTGCNTCD